MKILANPAFLATLMLLLAGAAAFVLGVLLMRRLRQTLTQEKLTATAAPESTAFAAATYQAVIQQLKEKEQELQRLRQAASERAAASENVSAAVLENLPSGVVLFNSAGLVQQVNPAARAILGYASMTGLHARDVFGAATLSDGEADGLASIAAIVDCCLKQGRIFRRLEADYVTPAGTKRLLGVTASPFTGGERRGTACLITDLTEVASLAKQLRLQESLAALGEMAAGIAHEFKNSLATISGYSQMLASEDDTESIRQFAAKIRGETVHLTRTVADFLNFARPQSVTPEPVKIAPLLSECATDAGIDLEASEVPAEFDVVADPTALRQCLQNLLRNSAEACPERKVRVRARAAVDLSNARLELRDDAGGIDPNVLPRIFIPFVTTKSAGNGLGLALAQRMISEHGGTISAANEGPGALFILSFPLQKLAKSARERG